MSNQETQDSNLNSFLMGSALRGVMVGAVYSQMGGKEVSKRDLMAASFFIEDFLNANDHDITMMANKVLRYHEDHGYAGPEESESDRYEQVREWLMKVQQSCKSQYKLRGIQGVLRELERNGVKASFSVGGEAAQNLYLSEKAKFNWRKFGEWMVAGLVSIAIFVAGVYFYVRAKDNQKTRITVEM